MRILSEVTIMQIKINGQTKTFADGSNLEAIIKQSCQNCQRVIAEVNGAIIKSQQWGQQPIRQGDQIELVSFVGGG